MESIKKFREQLAFIRNLKNEDSLNIDLLQYGVTPKYYDDIVNVVNLLVDFEKKYLCSHKLYNAISKEIEDADDDDIKLLVLVDIMRCYDGLNHPTSFTTPEGVALLILISRLYGIGNITDYESLRAVDLPTISITDIIPYISECSYELGNRYTLFLSELIEQEDAKIDTLYRIFIYNLCKKIAEVDGEVSIPEKEWLEEIARLDDNDETNDIDIHQFN